MEGSLEKKFFGRGGICISTRSRRLCIPEVLRDDYQLPRKHKRMKVRVLLGQKELKDGHLWTLTSDQLIVVRVRAQGNDVIAKVRECKISSRFGQLHVNNKRCNAFRLDIQTENDPIKFEGGRYEGTFSVLVHDDKVDLINSLDIEDYVYSVIRTESWPGWPLEVNKVQAVATRTYVVAKVLEGKRTAFKVPYHIKNTNIHQTYKGLHEFPSLKKATEETEGVIMTHNRNPIVAMFDACCGGIIPGLVEGVDFLHMPYLKRAYACTYCSDCKLFKYKSEYSLKEMRRLLKNQGIDVGAIKEMRVEEKDKAGIVKRVVVVGENGQEYLGKSKVYALCKKITSFAYDIKKSGNKIAFEGVGFGHHFGLCQWGARAMVGQGWRYKDILRYYYPGVQFMRLVYGW